MRLSDDLHSMIVVKNRWGALRATVRHGDVLRAGALRPTAGSNQGLATTLTCSSMRLDLKHRYGGVVPLACRDTRDHFAAIERDKVCHPGDTTHIAAPCLSGIYSRPWGSGELLSPRTPVAADIASERRNSGRR